MAKSDELDEEFEDLVLAEIVEERLQTPEDDLLSLEELAVRLNRRYLLEDS
jgi:hypothetical protein